MIPTISTILKQMRKKSGKSIEQAISELQSYGFTVSAPALYNYENGKRAINADVFLALCQIYNCTNPLEYYGIPVIDNIAFIQAFLDCGPEKQESIQKEVFQLQDQLKECNDFSRTSLYSLFSDNRNKTVAKPIDGIPTRDLDNIEDIKIMHHAIKKGLGSLPRMKDIVRKINSHSLRVQELPLISCDWILIDDKIAIRKSISTDVEKNNCIYEAVGYSDALESTENTRLDDFELYIKAKIFTVQFALPIETLIENGMKYKDYQSLADQFKVTPEFFAEAMNFYHIYYNGQAEIKDYVIKFTPKLIVKRVKNKVEDYDVDELLKAFFPEYDADNDKTNNPE